MAKRRYMPDGRRFFGRADLADLPDPVEPCPWCKQPWPDHAAAGGVSVVQLPTGESGYAMPSCPPKARPGLAHARDAR